MKCWLILSCAKVACGSGLEKIYSFLSAGDKVSAADPPVMKVCAVLCVLNAPDGHSTDCLIKSYYNFSCLCSSTIVVRGACGRFQLHPYIQMVPITSDPVFAFLQAPDVSAKGLSNEDKSASEALDIMLSILGAEAGNMSLRNLSRGNFDIDH